MNRKMLLTGLLALVFCLLTAGCAEETFYQRNDAEGYTVSVKFDANGGIFTTNTEVITDSFNISNMTPGSDGKVQIALLEPGDAQRTEPFTPVNNGYFLAGWYQNRAETVGANGEKEIVYSGKWDFENGLLQVDPSKTYTSSQPVMTLYAAWVPLFEIQFYDLATGNQLDSMTYNPLEGENLTVPAWDETTGTIKMHKFPTRTGYTFNGVYLDAEGKQAVTTQTISHPGSVDYANGVGKDTTLKLYVDFMEGEWYHIYNVDQFIKNASVTGSYVIHADLDFTDKIWPSSFMYGNYTGTIEGNGHTFKNIDTVQTNNSRINAGIFGHLTQTACIKDLTFENATFTIQSGTRTAGTSYGLLAGTISEGAQLTNVKILSSQLKIDSGSYFGTDDYVIGLLCGMGSADIDYSQITCVAVGDNPASVQIAVSGNTVTLSFVTA